MKPYKIDIKKLKESQEITEETELVKLSLVSDFLKITQNLSSSEIIERTGIDKSDLSRLRSMNISRFTIDRIISILDNLGFATKIKITPKKVS